MFFCDFDLINESVERKGRVVKVLAKKKACQETCLKESIVGYQVTGAGLNTASWLCRPH